MSESNDASLNDSPLDMQWFREMSANRETFVIRLFTVFINEEPKRAAKIKAAIDAGEATELKNLAHSLKGGAATLGCNGLRDLCLEMEHIALANDMDKAATHFDLITAEMNRVFAFMRAYLATKNKD